MKNIRCIVVIVFVVCLLPSLVFCQDPNPAIIYLKGVIVEQDTQLPLAYVNIGIADKPIGTLSDSSGNFFLSINKGNLSDTLLLTNIGYYSKKIAISEFIATNDKTISLTIKFAELREVIITNKKINTETIGRQSVSKLVQVSVHNKTSADATIGSEMGMRIKTNRSGAMLKDLNWYISANNFNQIKFRVNIYSIKDGWPDTLICNKQIFVTTDKFQTGWVKIDLETYGISIKDDFIITLQWIESSMEKKENPVTLVPVAVTPFSKNAYARIASQDKWKKMGVSFSCFVTLAY
jgi:CarboxypepD_reg-like domain